MKKIFIKLFIATFPFLCIIFLYVWKDPFKVVRHHAPFYSNYTWSIPINKDYVSTEQLLQNSGKYHYDSYVFGNSRSKVYRAAEWAKYISATNSVDYHYDALNITNIYHFDAFRETIFGIERKMNFLHERNMVMKNALIILDSQLMKTAENTSDFLYTKCPEITKESKFNFQLSFFKAFMDASFLTKYIKYLYNHKDGPSQDNNSIDLECEQLYNPVTNEDIYTSTDSAYVRNIDSVFADYLKRGREHNFYARTNEVKYSSPVIQEKQKKLLLHMKEILDADKTSYKIVISPLYDQKKIAESDIAYLKSVFGAANVFDFSGPSAITADKHNYYDNSHYRPIIANGILDSIYKKITTVQ